LTILQATPRLSEDKVKQCVDPRLEGDYPPKAVAKVKITCVPDGFCPYQVTQISMHTD
jgi:hypothetical protein